MEQWRAIVTFSLDADESSAVRNRVDRAIEALPFNKRKTGIYESCGSPAEFVAVGIARVVHELARPDAHLDHAWIRLARVVGE
jgi:hypothetical protein